MPSQVIRGFSYDEEQQALTITFVSSRRYIYRNVPQSVAQEFKAAFSKGSFFNSRIREHFDFREVEDLAS
jgi:hypothetical protein